MNKKTIKVALIFLLLIPLVVSLVLSCNNYNYTSFDDKSNYVDNLYIPDTIGNRKTHTVKRSDYFSYITIFGFITIAGITYVIVRTIKSK